MQPPGTGTTGPTAMREQLEWATTVAARFRARTSGASAEVVFAHLKEFTAVLEWACAEGEPQDVEAALCVADALGAAWERLGNHGDGRRHLDDILAAAARAGAPRGVALARVLRRRARLAMSTGAASEADRDLREAYDIALRGDEHLTMSVVLDRADLAMRQGAWERATELMPELLRRTQETGDPLVQAMGLNRAGWCAFGTRDLGLSAQRYEAAWALVELHEDIAVEARSASGLAITGMLAGDLQRGRDGWRRALELAEQLHDRAFTLHCLDGIAALLALSRQEALARQLSRSITSVREWLGHPREQAMLDLHHLVAGRAQALTIADGELWPYAEALARGRQAVAAPA